jgi:AcrR family transcriptional regulator
MGVTSAPRRQQILEAVVDYILEHGVKQLSLRPLAAACGTSARLLIYHFGSKEGVLAAAMGLLRDRLSAAVGSAQGARPSPGALLLDMWRLAIRGKSRHALALLFEVLTLAMRDPAPYREYVEASRHTWRTLIEGVLPRTLPSARRGQLSTYAIAALDGLLLDLLVTGDVQRTSAAMVLFAHEFDRLSRGTRS